MEGVKRRVSEGGQARRGVERYGMRVTAALSSCLAMRKLNRRSEKTFVRERGKAQKGVERHIWESGFPRHEEVWKSNA